ncbi:MAG: hypothetical protein GY940_01890 [bacterium]|nr:hypothetical protein [bacterium]
MDNAPPYGIYETPGLEVLSTLIYLVLVFASVIISVFGSMMIIASLTRRKIDVKEEIVYNRNVGIALVLGSFIWTIGQMCLEALKPIMNVWYSNYATGFTFGSAMKFTVGILGALLSSLFIGAIVVYLAVKTLMIINKDINEWDEIKRGNVAVAIIISITVVVGGMFFESIISYVVTSIFGYFSS